MVTADAIHNKLLRPHASRITVELWHRRAKQDGRQGVGKFAQCHIRKRNRVDYRNCGTAEWSSGAHPDYNVGFYSFEFAVRNELCFTWLIE